MIIPDKICDHCGGNDWIIKKKLHKGKSYTYFRCKTFDIGIKYNSKKGTKKYQIANKDKITKRQKSKQDKNSLLLADTHIKKLLRHQFPILSSKDIPDNVIQMKRKQLRLKRDVKTNKKKK